MIDPLCSILLQYGRLEIKDRSIGYLQFAPTHVLPRHYGGIQSYSTGEWRIFSHDAYGHTLEYKKFETTEKAFSYCIAQYRRSEKQATSVHGVKSV